MTPSPYAIFATTSGTASNVVNGSVVKSLNNLRDNVTLAAGANVTLTPSGNTLTIASTGGGGGSNGIWSLNGASAYYNGGNVGIGTTTPARELTVHALGHGIEHTDGNVRLGTYLDWTGGWLGTVSDHPLKFFVNDGAVPRLTIDGDATSMASGPGFVSVGTPNAESGITIHRGANRADLRFDGSTLKLVAGPAGGPPASTRGIAITTAGDVGIGTTNPGAKLHAETSQAYRAAVYGNATGVGGVGVFGAATTVNGTGVYGTSTTGAAMHAEGNATQARDKGGFVKAMARVNAAGPVARQYSALGGNITVARSSGAYLVTFPFQVNDRFISVTLLENPNLYELSVNVNPDCCGPNTVRIVIHGTDASGDWDWPINNEFFIFVY